MKNKKIFLLLSIAIISFTGCRKDGPPDKDETTVITSATGNVFITNEGNFQFGNAAVSIYNSSANQVTENIFEPANGRPLGDVCQSMIFFNNKAYVVVNNSGKIEVVNPASFKSIAIINGLQSPRYILPVSNSKAYVSDLSSGKISILDLSLNTVSGNIPCSGWAEEMVLSYGKAFVTNIHRNKVYVINTSTDLLEDSIQVGYSSNSIKEDKNGKLWVLCAGNQTSSYASLHKINPITHLVEQSYQFNNLTDNPVKLDINGTNDTLYFINDNIYRMSINASALPTTPFVSKLSNNIFYGIGIDPSAGVIYVADAIDYIQKGTIYRYSPNGILINSFKAGIIPNDFYFR